MNFIFIYTNLSHADYQSKCYLCVLQLMKKTLSCRSFNSCYLESHSKTCARQFVSAVEAKEQWLTLSDPLTSSSPPPTIVPPWSYSCPVQTFQKLLSFLSQYLKHLPPSPTPHPPNSFVPLPPYQMLSTLILKLLKNLFTNASTKIIKCWAAAELS